MYANMSAHGWPSIPLQNTWTLKQQTERSNRIFVTLGEHWRLYKNYLDVSMFRARARTHTHTVYQLINSHRCYTSQTQTHYKNHPSILIMRKVKCITLYSTLTSAVLLVLWRCWLHNRTRKPSCHWQTRATLAKSLHGLRKSSGVVSCIASLPIDSVSMVSCYVLYSNCVCKMRRFGDTRLLKLPCPWNPGQGSLKVIESDTIR